jgi:uncharacterized protein (TIGR02231 family)
MKKLMIIPMMSLIISGFLAASPVYVDSAIKSIIAYPDSAMVTREVMLNFDPGEYELAFTNIIPRLNGDTLRISAGGADNVKLYDVKYKIDYLTVDPSVRVQALMQDIDSLRDKIRVQENLKNVLSDEKTFLDSFRKFDQAQIPKDMATKMPLITDLDAVFKFYDQKLKDNFTSQMNCDSEIKKLNLKLSALQNELSQVQNGSTMEKRSVTVVCRVMKAGGFKLSLSYLVGNVSWFPTYEARADSEKNLIELISTGLVVQKTGEDWNNVDMSLSTARPLSGAVFPDIISWILRPAEQFNVSRMKKSAKYDRAEMPMPSAKSMGAAEDKEEALAPPEPEYATPEEKGTAVIFNIPRKVTIKADGSEAKLLLYSQNLGADFEYSSYPRSVPLAFLGSTVQNASNLQLLPGPVSIFQDGDYTGKTALDLIAPSEKFPLYLGSDPGVKVKRDLIERKADQSSLGNVITAVKQTYFKYRITVENFRKKPVKVKLFESLPVSGDERIKIKGISVNIDPTTKDWTMQKGVWLWEQTLQPSSKMEIIYSFTVEHPRDMLVPGL